MAIPISAALGAAQAKAAETARDDRVRGGQPQEGASGDQSGDQPGSPEAAAKDQSARNSEGDRAQQNKVSGDPDNQSDTTGATEAGDEDVGAKS